MNAASIRRATLPALMLFAVCLSACKKDSGPESPEPVGESAPAFSPDGKPADAGTATNAKEAARRAVEFAQSAAAAAKNAAAAAERAAAAADAAVEAIRKIPTQPQPNAPGTPKPQKQS